jgi:hypothetical protein
LQISRRYTAALFRGEQGTGHSEIHFDAATGIVTMELLAQDPNGYFIPSAIQPRQSRKTILLTSSGRDTFSKASCRDALWVSAGATASAKTHAQSNEEKRQ